MIRNAVIVSISAFAFTEIANAQQPSPEEAMARCIADVTDQAKAAGHDESRAPIICECLVPKVAEDPNLIAEIEANQGLPGPGEASEALDDAVKSCIPNT